MRQGAISRRGQGMPIQMIGVIVLVVLVIVAIAVFFFAGLSEQGAIISSTSSQTTGNLGIKLDAGLACLPPVSCCSSTQTPAINGCCGDCDKCPSAQGC